MKLDWDVFQPPSDQFNRLASLMAKLHKLMGDGTPDQAYRYVPVLKKEVRAAKRAEQAQAEEKMQIKAQRDELKKENKQLQKMVAGAKKMLLKLDDYLEKHLGISFKEALAEDQDKHREKKTPESEKKGPQGPSL